MASRQKITVTEDTVLADLSTSIYIYTSRKRGSVAKLLRDSDVSVPDGKKQGDKT